MSVKPLLTLLCLSLILPACRPEEELKLPVSLSLSIGLKPDAQNPPSLELQQGQIHIARLSAFGRRRQGDNISFTKNYQPSLNLDLLNNQIPQEWEFDFPQGAYDSLSFTLTLINQNPSIRLQGQKLRPSNQNFLLEIENQNLELQFIATSHVPNQAARPPIVLNQSQAKQAQLQINLYQWLNQIPDNLWQNTQTRPHQGQNLTRINPRENINLYQAIQNNINLEHNIVWN